ncbi:MAG: NADH-quinone oxidoreductase subunit K [Ignavibacteria bacterium]
METGINHFIFISAAMFCIGLYILLTAREAVKVITGLVILFAASILNISAFSGYWNFNPEGQITIYLVTAVCALNILAGIILMIKHYKAYRSNLFDEVKQVE